MPFLSLRGRIVVCLTFCFTVALVGAWLCECSDAVAFLPTRSGGAWIVAPVPPTARMHIAKSTRAVFNRVFSLSDLPVNARLSVCAFKTASVTVNGHLIEGLDCTGANWKFPVTAEVASLLQTGTNTVSVCVSNGLGPAALWLRLEAKPGALGSDSAWEVSLTNGMWQTARLATDTPAIMSDNPLYVPENMFASLKRVWPVLAIFCISALGLVVGIRFCLGLPEDATAIQHPGLLINVLLILVVIARAALFEHDLPRLPYYAGFDAQFHENYVKFVEDNHELPLPNQGWEMYQPPLYYSGSALLLGIAGLGVDDRDGRALLRTVNGLGGLAHCWLAVLCLRRLFPGNVAAQAVGLLVAAFVPPHLYLSMYVTNEAMSGLLVSIAFYCCLRLVQAEEAGLWPHFALGLALGVALLTKVSALLAAPLFFLAAGWRLLAQKKHSPWDWLRSLGIMALAVTSVCGWYYAWIWSHFGRPIVANWDKDIGKSWWLDFGYNTSAYFSGFGESLTRPLFSGFHSFADGIYSTLWGDGLIGGMTHQADRPPWNYDLMNLLYLLSLPLTLFAATGFIVRAWQLIRQPRMDWLLVIGMVTVFGLGLIFMTLHVPGYGQAKAFYGFPALLAFSAIVAAGWSWLAKQNRCWHIILWSLVTVWVLTAFSTFWISAGSFG